MLKLQNQIAIKVAVLPATAVAAMALGMCETVSRAIYREKNSPLEEYAILTIKGRNCRLLTASTRLV